MRSGIGSIVPRLSKWFVVSLRKRERSLVEDDNNCVVMDDDFTQFLDNLAESLCCRTSGKFSRFVCDDQLKSTPSLMAINILGNFIGARESCSISVCQTYDNKSCTLWRIEINRATIVHQVC